MPQLTTFRLYLLGIALLFGGYVMAEYNRPKPLNWTPTFANKDKIPYGTYALYDQLPRLLGTDSIEVVRLPVYSQLTGLDAEEAPSSGSFSPNAEARTDTAQNADSASDNKADADEPDSTSAEAIAAADSAATDSGEESETEEAGDDDESEPIPLRASPANYLFVNQEFQLSKPDALALLQFVAGGGDAFVAAQEFSVSGASRLLRDSLGLAVDDVVQPTHRGPQGLPVPDSVALHFTNPALAGAAVHLPGRWAGQRIRVDSGRVGRTLAADAQDRAVLVRLDHGRGHFYVCTVPVAFTNYYLLRPRTAAFAAAALAYLPARRTFWDEYQKQGPAGEQSLLRVVMAHDALRLAYYLALVGGLLFVLVAARRRQRIIPTIKALPNTTLLFTRTVAGLYRQGRSHALIAEKKVALFTDYLRTRFQEASPDFGDADFRERLSQKAGVPRARVDELLRLVNFARTAPQMSDRELLILSKALNDFRREASR